MTTSVYDIISTLIGVMFLTTIIGGHYLLNIIQDKQHFTNRLMNLAQRNVTTNQPLKKQNLFNLRRDNILQKRFKRYQVKYSMGQVIKQTLYKAGIQLPILYVVMMLMAMLSTVAMAFWKLFLTTTITSSVWAVIIVGFIGYLFLEFRKEKHRRLLITLLPHALDIMIRGLKAGFSVEKTFMTVANEIQEPVGNEFKTICEQIAFGMSFEDAVKNAAERLQDADFDFFVIALIIQRRTGGSLAELLINIAGTLRKREELRLKIKSLSGEAKATGSIVGVLPIIATAFMCYIQPGYLQKFTDDPTGLKLLYTIGGLLVFAILFIKKLIKFEI